jgi:hypothetical protein
MIYRKHPPQPPRLLLRIASAAGTGVLLGAAACSSSSSSGGADPSHVVNGSAITPPDDSGTAVGDQEYVGLACGGGVCGSVALPPDDAGPDAYPNGIDAGILVAIPDASDKDAPIADATGDAPFRCLGVCIEPDAEVLPDSGFHGIIVGVVVRPDE